MFLIFLFMLDHYTKNTKTSKKISTLECDFMHEFMGLIGNIANETSRGLSTQVATDENLGISPEPAAPTDIEAQSMSTIPEVTSAMEQLKLPAEGYLEAEISDSLQSTEDSRRLSAHSIPPPLRTRPRAISTLSIASTAMSHTPSFITDNEEDEGESSSDDSILSFWSSDESSSESEDETEPEEEPPADDKLANIEKPRKERRAAPKPPKKEIDAEKEVERKKREEQRQAILAATGLQLKREPSGAPAQRLGRVASRRRPAPNVPGRKRRHAPAVPEGKSKKLPSPPSKEIQSDRLETGDAYARYEAFLAQSAQVQSQPLPRPEAVRTESRPPSQVLSPQHTGPTAGAALSPASTTTSLPISTLSLGKETGGKITGFLKSMMTPHGHEPKRPSISGPTITRVDEPPASPAPGSGIFSSGEELDAGFGKTWSSLVEPSVLETMDKRERKRQEAIFEFVATEIGYNRDLQLIVEVRITILSILQCSSPSHRCFTPLFCLCWTRKLLLSSLPTLKTSFCSILDFSVLWKRGRKQQGCISTGSVMCWVFSMKLECIWCAEL